MFLPPLLNSNKISMTLTIFTDDFPIVTTDKELASILALYPNYDGYYVTSGCVQDRRDRFNSLWPQFEPYADRHFLTDIKLQFHQRTWEMYVGNVFLKNNLQIVSDEMGPDFLVNSGGKNIYVECIAPNTGDKGSPYSVPELKVGREIASVQDVPFDKMILRITQAINEKRQKYLGWIGKDWFKQDIPYVIAINSGAMRFPQNYLGIPLVIKALFGLEFLQVNQNRQSSFTWRNDIPKGDSSVSVTYFANDSFKEVSGVIFSDKAVLNHPDEIGDDCIFINNPYASNPCPADCFPFLKKWHAEKGGLQKLY